MTDNDYDNENDVYETSFIEKMAIVILICMMTYAFNILINP